MPPEAWHGSETDSCFRRTDNLSGRIRSENLVIEYKKSIIYSDHELKFIKYQFDNY
ncbi:Uncharacterized protein dnm_085650 [Desulfonema magnum]|uniref:Uncharacterized protein n=1 Tax=Desulfonema magnum TaxID=45655 RepID=A0A975BWM3_9BACT|nr:Uncharacterized protein dnm_085650 [Desulfonema magnum]